MCFHMQVENITQKNFHRVFSKLTSLFEDGPFPFCKRRQTRQGHCDGISFREIDEFSEDSGVGDDMPIQSNQISG